MSITQQQALDALGQLDNLYMFENRNVEVLRQYIEQAQPAEDAPKLWLWKNFVNGRPEYWAFDNPYPINLDNGDPQTLGEPCGYAILKPSRSGRPDFSEDEVLLRIAQAESKVSYNLGPNKADADAFDFLRFAKKNLDTHAARVPFAYNGLVTAAVAWIQAAENILAAQSPAQAPVQPQAVVPDADRASSGAAQAVRMLTEGEAISAAEDGERSFRRWTQGVRGQMLMPQDSPTFHYVMAGAAKSLAVNAGKRIPADGKIGGV